MEVLGHRKLNQTRKEAQSPGRESGVKLPRRPDRESATAISKARRQQESIK